MQIKTSKSVDTIRGHTRVLSLDTRTLALREVMTVHDTRGYPWLDVGSRSGRIYLLAEHQVHLVVVDPASGREIVRWAARRPVTPA